MKIKIRYSNTSKVLTLDSDATIEDLISDIRKETSFARDLDIRLGFPPKSLDVDSLPKNSRLDSLPTKLDGVQLAISEISPVKSAITAANSSQTSSSGASKRPASPPANSNKRPAPDTAAATSGSSFSFLDPFETQRIEPEKENKKPAKRPLGLTRKAMPDPPGIRLESGRGTLHLRIMPDDNSCLFRAIGCAFMGSEDTMVEMRQLVASAIQSDPEQYNEVVLEQPPDKYCEWINTDYAWGGAIEIKILAEHLDTEIISIDISSGQVYRFNENASGGTSIILMYSGIHYDTVALVPDSEHYSRQQLVSDDEVRVFQQSDEEILRAAEKLSAQLQKMHYFTDTAKFTIRCSKCKAILIGEGGAKKHAEETGHDSFEEDD